MTASEGANSYWRRKIRGGRKVTAEGVRAALPMHDDSQYELHPSVIEAEQAVAAALCRWATSAGLHGGDDEFVPYRTEISGREMIKLLAAAAREDLAT